MKKALFNIFCFALLFSEIPAQTIVGGAITSNTTWTVAGSPYVVKNANIAVMQGVTLSIEPGVIVKFDSLMAIQVFGSLRALGTATDPVLFTSNTANPSAGDWGYILFNSNSEPYNFNDSTGSVLEHCIIEYAGGANTNYNGIIRIDNAKPYITHTTVQNNNKSAIKIWNLIGKITLDNCIIKNNISAEGIVHVTGNSSSRITIYNTEISNNSDGIYINTANATISNCHIFQNNGNAITGYDKSNVYDTITACYISENANGIFYYNSTNTRFYINENTITNNANNGIFYNDFNATSSNQYKIISNQISNNVQNGIHWFYFNSVSAATITLTDNIIHNNQLNGIYMYSNKAVSSYTNTITGNSISFNNENGFYYELDRITSSTFSIANNNIGNNYKNGFRFFPYSIYNYSNSNTLNFTSNTLIKNNEGGIHINVPYEGLNSGGSNTCLLTKNKFIANSGLDGGGLYLINKTLNIPFNLSATNNIFAENIALDKGGAVYFAAINGNLTLTKNNICNNLADRHAALYISCPGNITAQYNSIVNNRATNTASSTSVLCEVSNISTNPNFNYNNIYNSGCSEPSYNLWFNSFNGDSLIARNCYWNKLNYSAVDSTIYDYFDNLNLGIVWFSPFDTNHVISAPISAVAGISKNDLGNGNILVQWSANPESDVTGYKIYWGNYNGYSFINEIDVGNVTSYILSGVLLSDTLVVTAYDTGASLAGTEAQVMGNESWFYNVENMIPSITVQGNTVLCQGDSTLLIANAGYNLTYQWFKNGNIMPNAMNDSLIVTQSGSYTVDISNGCPFGSQPVSILVNPLPEAAGNINGPINVCIGDTNILYYVASILHAETYEWVLPSGVTAQMFGDSIFVSFDLTAVSGLISVKGVNGCGYGQENFLYVEVNQLPANAGTIFGPSVVCEGQSGVTFYTNPITNADTYEWIFPDSTVIITLDTFVTFDFPLNVFSGSISVCGQNICGKGNVASFTIDINPLPGMPEMIYGLTVVCQGQSGVLYTVPVVSGATSYIWDLPYGCTGIDSSNTIVVDYGLSAQSGNISVAASNSQCGTGSFNSVQITVHPKPPTPVITESGNQLYSDAPQGNQWYFNGSPVPNATDQYFLFNNDGFYNVVVSLSGCSSDTSNTIHIINIGSCHDNLFLTVNIYPNPSKDFLTIDVELTKTLKSLTVEIRDILGHLLIEENITNKTSTIDISSISSGYYFLSLKWHENYIIKSFVKK